MTDEKKSRGDEWGNLDPDAPFLSNDADMVTFDADAYLETIRKGDARTHVKVIATFLLAKRKRYGTPELLNKAQVGVAIQRYSRVAVQVSQFTPRQFVDALHKAFALMDENTTLETVYKMLTR